MGHSVTQTILGIVRGDSSPSHLHCTFITLIPKKSSAHHMSNFRPISLCDVVYKLVSKVLANRLEIFLDDIVCVTQSAFTPGRA